MADISSSVDNALKGHMTRSQVLKYTLPSIITAVFTAMYMSIDSIFVANIAGSLAFASLNLVMPIFLILASFGMMFGTGGNALVSKVRGEGRDDEAKSIFSTLTLAVVILSIIISLLLSFFLDDLLLLLGATKEMMPFCMLYSRILIPFIICYLFQYYFQNMLVTAGKGLLGFAMTVVAGVVNIVGDAILVGVVAKTPEEALAGAAIATCAGLFVGGAIPLFYFLRKNSSFLKLVKPKMNFKVIRATCSNGVSEFLSNVSGAVMNTVFNGLLLYIVGQKGVSAYGSIGNINTLFCAVFMGYSVGIAPAISYKYGAKDHTELKHLYKNSLFIIAVISIAMVAIAEIFATPLSAIFVGSDKALLEMTVIGFHIYAISFMFKGFNTFASAFFTALNNGLISGVLSVCRALVFSIGAVLILPLVFYSIYGADTAIYGIWWSTSLAELLGIIMVIVFLKKKRKYYNY